MGADNADKAVLLSGSPERERLVGAKSRGQPTEERMDL